MDKRTWHFFLFILGGALSPTLAVDEAHHGEQHKVVIYLVHEGLQSVLQKMEKGEVVHVDPRKTFRLAIQEPKHSLIALRRLVRYHDRCAPLSCEDRDAIMCFALKRGSPAVIHYLLKAGIYDIPVLHGKAKHGDLRHIFAWTKVSELSPRRVQEIREGNLLPMQYRVVMGYVQIFALVQQVLNISWTLVHWSFPVWKKRCQRSHPLWYSAVDGMLRYSLQGMIFHLLGKQSGSTEDLSWKQHLTSSFILFFLVQVLPICLKELYINHLVEHFSSIPSYLISAITIDRNPAEKKVIVKMLLMYGANPNEVCLDTMPLSFPPQLPTLYKVVFDLQHYITCTPLSLAAERDLYEVAKVLVAHGARVNQSTLTGDDYIDTSKRELIYVPIATLYWGDPDPLVYYRGLLDHAPKGSKTYAYLKEQGAVHSQ